MVSRKRSGKAGSRGRISAGRLIFWGLLLLETAWLIAFILGTGSLIPPGLPRRSSSGAPAWDATKEAQFEDLQIQKILGEKGSRDEKDAGRE